MGNAKVGHDDMAPILKDVLRLQIAMPDTQEVRRLHAIKQLREARQDLGRKQAGAQSIPKGSCIIGHHIKRCRRTCFSEQARVYDFHEVWMIAARTKGDLALEALQPLHCEVLTREELDGHTSAISVDGLKHLTSPTLA
jgi:hypothetical protein